MEGFSCQRMICIYGNLIAVYFCNSYNSGVMTFSGFKVHTDFKFYTLRKLLSGCFYYQIVKNFTIGFFRRNNLLKLGSFFFAFKGFFQAWNNHIISVDILQWTHYIGRVKDFAVSIFQCVFQTDCCIFFYFHHKDNTYFINKNQEKIRQEISQIPMEIKFLSVSAHKKTVLKAEFFSNWGWLI